MSKKKIKIEEFKELIDSRVVSKWDRKDDSTALLRARLESSEKSSSEDDVLIDLYRLKLMLEDEAETPELKSPFYSYSSTYVDLLYNTRKSFASDIGFSQTQVSLILNGKRPPTDEFVAKIRLHSEKIYQKLNIDFNASNWFTVYYLDRMNAYLHNNKKEKVSLSKVNRTIRSLKIG
ncbi:MAG: helix-turn-helix domain-containing protein [Crocinitomicaceae bacterium]